MILSGVRWQHTDAECIDEDAFSWLILGRWLGTIKTVMGGLLVRCDRPNFKILHRKALYYY